MHEVIKLLFWVQTLYNINLFYNFHKILGLKIIQCVGGGGVLVHICVFAKGEGGKLFRTLEGVKRREKIH
jgi:hypothetical protein